MSENWGEDDKPVATAINNDQDWGAGDLPAGQKPAGALRRLKQGISNTVDAARVAATNSPEEIAGIMGEADKNRIPASPAQVKMQEEIAPYVKRANEATGVVDNVLAWGSAAAKRAGQFIQNPSEFVGMVAENLPNSAPGMAGGLAGAAVGSSLGPVGTAVGGVVGGTAGGYAVEQGSSMQEQIQKEAQARGVSLQDKAGLTALISEKYPEFLEASRLKGIGTAGTDAVLNVATMGLAGAGERAIAKEARALGEAAKAGKIGATEAAQQLAEIEAKNAARSTLGATVKRGAGVTGAEMLGEGASEAVGQKLGYGNVDAGDVIDESLLGLGTGVGMAAGHKVVNKVTGSREFDPASAEIKRASESITPPVSEVPPSDQSTGVGSGMGGTEPFVPPAFTTNPQPTTLGTQITATAGPGFDVNSVLPKSDPVRDMVQQAADAGGPNSAAALVGIDSGAHEIQFANVSAADQAAHNSVDLDSADKPITHGQIAEAAMSDDDKRAVLYSNQPVADGGQRYPGTQDGDILNGSGAPFSTWQAAGRRATMEGKSWTIAKVADGFVARRKDATDGKSKTQQESATPDWESSAIAEQQQAPATLDQFQPQGMNMEQRKANLARLKERMLAGRTRNGTTNAVQSLPATGSGIDGNQQPTSMGLGNADGNGLGADAGGYSAHPVVQSGEQSTAEPSVETTEKSKNLARLKEKVMAGWPQFKSNPQPTTLGTQTTAKAGPGFDASYLPQGTHNVRQAAQAVPSSPRQQEAGNQAPVGAATTTTQSGTAGGSDVQAAGVEVSQPAQPVANAGEGAGASQPTQAANAVEESQQDKSIREWTENYDKVSNTDNLSGVSDADLARAIAWASRKKQSEQRKGWDGGQPNQNVVDALTAEIERIKAEESRRRGEPTQAAPNQPALVRIKSIDGKHYHVQQSDLDSGKSLLPTYTANGKRSAVRIHRENLDPTGEKQAANNAEDANNPLFNVIATKNGAPFGDAAAANRALKIQKRGDTHEVVPASEVKPGMSGFVLRRKVNTGDKNTANKQVLEQKAQTSKDYIASVEQAKQDAQQAAQDAPRETVTPAEDKPIGKNDAGEQLYERKDGSVYRMRDGKPDFGGDLAPKQQSAPANTASDATEKAVDGKQESQNSQSSQSSQPSNEQSAKSILSEREKAAKAKMHNALGKLAALATKNTRMNWTAEEEQQLLPIVIELFDGAVELGAVTFQKAVAYVRDFISTNLDKETADAIPFETLQGAYIAMSGRHKDKAITPRKEVVAFDSLAELEKSAPKADTTAKDQANEPTNTGSENPQALGDMAPEQDGGTESKRRVGRGRKGRSAGGVSDDSGLTEPRVSGTRSGGSGSTSVRAPKSGGTGRGRRTGAGTEGNGSQLPAERGTAPDSGLSNTPAAEPVSASNIQATNFRITPDLRLGQGGESEKFRDNLAAIRTLKAIEAEGRRATSEEQRILARYVGWGGLANAFPSPETKEWKDDWKARGAELKDLLTAKEYDLARRSTLDSHYTSQTVVSAMWDAAKRLGFSGGMAAETSMGIGNFMGLMPEGIAGNTRFIGVEYDSLTARMAALLYPQATVLHSGLQKVPLPDSVFDLNIGNPPFGDQSLRFQFKPEFNRVSIHNQFFLAGIDSLKPGGLQLNVVSRYLLDAMDKTTRTMLAKKAKLVAAIRLPDTAFKENARTSVVTDIVMLQRLTPGEQAEMEAAFQAAASKPDKDHQKEAERRALAALVPEWVEVTKMRDPLGGDPMTVNSYFAKNPGMILGTLERSGKMQFKNDITVRPSDRDLGEMLAEAVAKLPEGIANTSQDAVAASLERYTSLSDALKIALSGQEAGSITFNQDGQMEQVYERETPEGDYELTKRVLTESSPWSESLYQDAKGNWFTIEAKLDEQGNKVKVMKDGKPTKNNVYERKVYASEADIPSNMRIGDKKLARLQKMVKLRDLMVNQINLETEDAPPIRMEGNRQKLAKAYRDFVESEGFISRQANASLVANMPDGALVQALELSYRKEITKDQAKKLGESPRPEQADPAPILSERVIPKYEPPTKAASAADALSITMSESGRVDIERIASLLGKSEEEVIAEMFDKADKPLIFKDPETQQWVTRNDYLTGQVKKKLHAAQAAGLDKHVKELEAVQPEPWGAENVTVLLGSTFVPPQVYADFIEHVTGKPARVSFQQSTNSYAVQANGATQEKQDEWGAEGVSIGSMVSDMLNSTSIKVMTKDADGNTVLDKERTDLAQLKARQIASEFTDWAFANGDRRKLLVDLFNEKYNTRVTRQHDGSHLTLPGKVPDAILRMRRHQKNAIWRGISERFMLIDHAVGAGKTFTAIARAMERRRMGLSRKPAIVVPNHMVEQFTSDVYRLYPGAKVLAAGGKDFEKKKRRKLFAKIASGDWDIVIIPHSSFGFIGIAPETEERYLEKELALAEQAIKDAWEESEQAESSFRKPFNVKTAERLRDKITARMDSVRGNMNKDRLLTFEQMGIDDLTVDEAHEFKNLFYSTRLKDVKGMGNQSGSQKAFDLYNKVRVLRESPTGTVTFMTGTPISNSAVEMFTMMRYLAADELNELGLEHFDAWRAQFVSADPGWEPTETGRLKEVTRLGRSWSNMRSLMDLYYSFTDSVSNDDIKKAYAEDNNGAKFPITSVKGGDRRSVVIQPTDDQAQLLTDTMAAFDSLPDIEDPYERNKERLRLMDRARKISLDVRAAVAGHPGKEKGGKLDKIAEEVKRIYTKFDSDKGTQLIFLDRSVPKSKGDDKEIKEYDELIAKRNKALLEDNEAELRRVSESLERFDPNEIAELRAAQAGGWNAYQQIKDNLIAQGIPAKEIRFVQEATNDAQKQALFDAVNAGEVRVLIGSTPRMGAGTNVQQRLVGLHHADVTWKPSDIEQREGRIIRQGNKLLDKYGIDNFEVEILAYATERTIDSKMWSLNSAKLKTINAIRNYDGSFSMDFDDNDSVSMAEMAALASGNPLLLERVKLDSDINNLEILRKQHQRKTWGYKSRMEDAENDIRNAKPRQALNTTRAAQAKIGADELAADLKTRSVTVEGQTYTNHSDAVKAAEESRKAQQGGDEEAKFSIKIGDSRVTSMNGAFDKVYAALGDDSPFLAKVAGKEYRTRTDLAREIAKLATEAGPDMVDGETKLLATGQMLGFTFEANMSRGSYRGYEVDFSLVDADGRTVTSTISRPQQDSKIVTSMLSKPLADLDRGISPGYFESEARMAVQRAEKAEKELPDLRTKANLPFAKEAELTEKRARLAKVIAALAGNGKLDEEVKSTNTKQTGDFAGNDTDVVFSQNLLSPKSLGPKPTPDQIQRLVDKVQQVSKNVIPITIVGNPSQIPGVVSPVGAKPTGAVIGGKIYLFADNIRSIGDAYVTIFHELFHLGLKQVLPAEDYAALLRKFSRNLLVQRFVREWKASPEGIERSADMNSEAYDTLAAEEALAMISEELHTNRGIGTNGTPSMVKAMLSWLSDVADRIGLPANFGEWMRGLTRTDAEKFVSDMVRAAMGGEKNLSRTRNKYGTSPDIGTEQSDIRFRSFRSETIQKAGDVLNESFNYPGTVSKWHTTVGSMYNLAERNQDFKQVFNATQDFLNDVSYYGTEAADMAPKIMPKLETLKDLVTKQPISYEDNKAIAAPIFQGTLSWARDVNGKPVLTDDLKARAADMTAEQKAQDMLRAGKLDPNILRMWQGMEQDHYEAAVNSRYENVMLKPGVVWTDAELKSIFKLNDAQVGLYHEFRNAINTSIDNAAKAAMLRTAGKDVQAMRDMVMDAPTAEIAGLTLRDHLQGMAQDNPDRSDELIAMANEMMDQADKAETLKKEGYAPLSRFGHYTVDVVVNGERKYFSMFESKKEANRVANLMRQEYGAGNVAQATMSEREFEQFQGITPESMELFGNMLGLDSTGNEAQDKAFQTYLRKTKANRSAMKRLIHRKGIAGYSEDVGRVLAAFVYSNARQTAGALNLGKLSEAVNETQGELKDVAIGLQQYVTKPQEEAQAIRGMMFAQYLGGSIASMMVNLTQPMAISFPYLSQYGAGKAAKALTKAYADMKGGDRSLENGLQQALKIAEEQGIVAPQEVHQLMAQAQGKASLHGGDGTKLGNFMAKSGNAFTKLALGWGKLFGWAEQINRKATFIAAYRMAAERGDANPFDFAKKAVNETQFINNRGNKMQWGRGAIGATLMTFKSYSINYLELLHRMATRNGPEGKKAAAIMLGMLLLMAGAGGLPFADDLNDLLDFFAERMGYNFSTKKAKQEFLEGLFGKAMADFIDRGITGLPGSPIDVSGRMSMANLLPGTGLLLEKRDHTKDAQELLGPVGDMATRSFQAVNSVLDGDIKRALLAVAPKAISNAAQGFDMSQNGYYADAKGYKVLSTTPGEAVAKAIGFQPQSVSMVQESNAITQRMKDTYALHAEKIRSEWAKGVFEHDPDQIQKARDMLKEWNDKNPDQRIIVRIPDVMKKARDMAKDKEQRIADTAPKAMRAHLKQEIQQRKALQ